jgi:hypothetical protein
MVIHAFVDGFSRYIVGIQVVNNNRAATVLDLFHQARARHGTPSRVRGDHGVENVLVSAAMDDLRGVGRGSYIWGRYGCQCVDSLISLTSATPRSIHNTRIERLWYDVTSGFGAKWKDFFVALEHNDGLNPSFPSHIWLVHFLFRTAIDEDAQQWAAAWNCHRMQIRGERSRSPEDMFMAGILQRGAQGLDLRPSANLNEDIGDVHQYGVDWGAHRDRRLMQHLHEHNPGDNQAADSFRLPEHMARVECEPPNSPFSSEEMNVLRERLSIRVGEQAYCRDMPTRRVLWCHAFAIAREIKASRGLDGDM